MHTSRLTACKTSTSIMGAGTIQGRFGNDPGQTRRIFVRCRNHKVDLPLQERVNLLPHHRSCDFIAIFLFGFAWHLALVEIHACFKRFVKVAISFNFKHFPGIGWGFSVFWYCH